MSYDVLDRVVRMESPASTVSGSTPGLRVSMASFDPGSSLTTDPNGNQRRSFVDAFGQVVKVEEITPDGTFTTLYAYDVAGNLVRVTDHEGNQTRITYSRTTSSGVGCRSRTRTQARRPSRTTQPAT